MRKAIFLDRDGVINPTETRQDRPFAPIDLGETSYFPEVPEVLSKFKSAGYLIFVVTNQPDVSNGLQKQEVIEKFHHRLLKELPIDEISVCYHTDKHRCDCRKPMPGLILNLAKRYDVDLASSFMIGDRWRDVEAGHAAGCLTIFIDYSYLEKTPAQPPHFSVANLKEASSIILNFN